MRLKNRIVIPTPSYMNISLSATLFSEFALVPALVLAYHSVRRGKVANSWGWRLLAILQYTAFFIASTYLLLANPPAALPVFLAFLLFSFLKKSQLQPEQCRTNLLKLCGIAAGLLLGYVGLSATTWEERKLERFLENFAPSLFVNSDELPKTLAILEKLKASSGAARETARKIEEKFDIELVRAAPPAFSELCKVVSLEGRWDYRGFSEYQYQCRIQELVPTVDSLQLKKMNDTAQDVVMRAAMGCKHEIRLEDDCLTIASEILFAKAEKSIARQTYVTISALKIRAWGIALMLAAVVIIVSKSLRMRTGCIFYVPLIATGRLINASATAISRLW